MTVIQFRETKAINVTFHLFLWKHFSDEERRHDDSSAAVPGPSGLHTQRSAHRRLPSYTSEMPRMSSPSPRFSKDDVQASSSPVHLSPEPERKRARTSNTQRAQAGETSAAPVLPQEVSASSKQLRVTRASSRKQRGSFTSEQVTPQSSDEEEALGGLDEDYVPPSGPVSRTKRQSTKKPSAPAAAKTQYVSATATPEVPHKTSAGRKRGTTSSASTTPASSGRWKDRDEEDTPPAPHRFKPKRAPGPVLDTTTNWTVLQLFQLFFSSSAVNTIIDNTNRNAKKRKETQQKQYKWTPLTVKDFYIFLAIILYTGLVKMPERPDYWRTSAPYNHPFPANKMSRERFEAIVWTIHLSNPDEDEDDDRQKDTDNYDRLFKIKPLYSQIVGACKAFFHPGQNICIDERMVASKAHIGMKQYHKDKPTKWGYKLFVLADSSNGYTWNFFVYQGRKNKNSPDVGLSYSSVMDLMDFTVLGSGYTLFVDNFYTSTTLFKDLLKNHTGACGTIRTNRSGFPKATENDLAKTAAKGEIRWIREDNILYVKWMDKREVTMCSSVHGVYSGRTVTRKIQEQGVRRSAQVPCPDAVVDYNQHMGGVDLSDALIGYYTVLHKTMEWYKTFFYHFVDIAVVNAHILHKEIINTKADGTKPLSQKAFREKLLLEMLEFARDSDPTPPATPTTCMPQYYGEDATKGRKHCRKCFAEGNKRVKTPVYCRKCKVPLCLTSKKNCFADWHDAH